MRKIFLTIAILFLFAYPVKADSGYYCTATGAVAVAASCSITDSRSHLNWVSLKLSAAASTSENVTITLDSGNGAAYDVVLVAFDPSVIGGTSFVWIPDYVLTLGAGDKIVVTYTNTDTRTYGLQVRYSL
jgi:hypothetical protein